MNCSESDIVSGRILSSQTIGVEFASKIVKVGTGSRRKRIKLQVCMEIPLHNILEKEDAE
jgi:hypothetical protein